MSDKVTFTISGYQVIVRKAKKIGNGAYAPIPVEWLDHEVTIILTGDEKVKDIPIEE